MADENPEEHNLVNVQETDDNVPKNSPSEEIPAPENDSGVSEDKKWPGWPGHTVFRMLVPAWMVNSIIGPKGEYIERIREETKARIHIVDAPVGTKQSVVMISAKEEPDLDVSPAMDGLLKIHKRLVDLDSSNVETVFRMLLVAETQALSLIGKKGATKKSIENDSECTIHVREGEYLPVFALPDDKLVKVIGKPAGLHKAVELIAAHLRKFLVDQRVVGEFEKLMRMPDDWENQIMPPTQYWGPPPQGFPMSVGGGPQYMPPLGKQSSPGPPPYGRDTSAGSHTSLQPKQSIVEEVTQNMQFPLSYADAIIGISGANISCIRRSSGAIVAIQETSGVPSEITVEIRGTASQVQAARGMIQNTATAIHNYPHGLMHASPPSNTSRQAGHAPSGDYGYKKS